MPRYSKSRMKPNSRRSIALQKRAVRLANKANQDAIRQGDKALRAASKKISAGKAAERKRERALRALETRRARRRAALLDDVPKSEREALNRHLDERRIAFDARLAARAASGLPQPLRGFGDAARAHNEALYESAGWIERMQKIIELVGQGLDFEDAAEFVAVAPLTAGMWFHRRHKYLVRLGDNFENPYVEHLTYKLVAARNEFKQAKLQDEIDRDAGIKRKKNRRFWERTWKDRTLRKIKRLQKELGIDYEWPA